MATEHFSDDELRCRCGCGRVEMDDGFMEWLEEVRVAYGQPIYVTSGFRCDDPRAHGKGCAIDAAVSHMDARRLAEIALMRKVRGLGIRQHGPVERRFLHLDMWADSSKRPAWWTYDAGE